MFGESFLENFKLSTQQRPLLCNFTPPLPRADGRSGVKYIIRCQQITQRDCPAVLLC